MRFRINSKKPGSFRIAERVRLYVLDQDIDSDIFPLTCLEVVDAWRGFDELASVRLINGQLCDF